MVRWMGLSWQSELLCSKSAGLLCSTLSDHHMMTGFGPFEPPPINNLRVKRVSLNVYCAKIPQLGDGSY